MNERLPPCAVNYSTAEAAVGCCTIVERVEAL